MLSTIRPVEQRTFLHHCAMCNEKKLRTTLVKTNKEVYQPAKAEIILKISDITSHKFSCTYNVKILWKKITWLASLIIVNHLKLRDISISEGKSWWPTSFFCENQDFQAGNLTGFHCRSWPKDSIFICSTVEIWGNPRFLKEQLRRKYPPGNDHISHLGKRTIIDSKCHFWGIC